MRLVLFLSLLFSLGCQSHPQHRQSEETTERDEEEVESEADQDPLSDRVRRASPRRYIK